MKSLCNYSSGRAGTSILRSSATTEDGPLRAVLFSATAARGLPGDCPPYLKSHEFMAKSTNLVTDPDHHLLIRASLGDTEAFGEIVKKHRHPITMLATRVLRDPIEAEDVAQNVFVQAFRQSERFRFECTLSTWLQAIARNLCRNELRRRSRQQKDSLEAYTEAKRLQARCLQTPLRDWMPQPVMRRELEEQIDLAIATLPERQRVAIRLLIEEEWSYEQISAGLNASLATTKALIYRARRELRRLLQPVLAPACAALQGNVAVPQRVVRKFLYSP